MRRLAGIIVPIYLILSGLVGAAPGELESEISSLAQSLETVSPQSSTEAVRSLLFSEPPGREFSAKLALALLDHPDVDLFLASQLLFRENLSEKLVPGLASTLASDTFAQAAAAYDLARIGPEARASVSALAAALKTSDKHPRSLAAVALAMIGPDARSAVPALIEMAGEEGVSGSSSQNYGHARTAACFALGAIGPDARVAVPFLLRILGGDGDPGNAAPLVPREEYLRAAVCFALGRVGADQSAVPFLVQALKDGSPVVRRQAALALSSMGSTAWMARPNLMELLRDPEVSVSRSAARALALVQPLGQREFPSLFRDLMSKDPDLRCRAAWTVGGLRGGVPQAIPGLVRSLKDSSPRVRTAAALALGAMGREAELAVPALAKALEDSSRRVFDFVPGILGPVASDSTELEDSGEPGRSQLDPVRESAAYALAFLSSESSGGAISETIKQLGVPGSARLIRALGNVNRNAVPVLFCALDDEENVRSAAAEALGRIGGQAVNAVPALRKLLDDEDWVVRQAASSALDRLAPRGTLH